MSTHSFAAELGALPEIDVLALTSDRVVAFGRGQTVACNVAVNAAQACPGATINIVDVAAADGSLVRGGGDR